MAEFHIGLDLGQKRDFTAIAAIESVGRDRATLHLRHLERFRGVQYPEVVKRVAALMGTPPLAGQSQLVVDATGLGVPVLDQLRQHGVTPVTGVTITSGKAVSGGDRLYRVPKNVLVKALVTGIETARLQIAAGLPERTALIEELLQFRVRISECTGALSYGASKNNDHDDLVLAVALALWGVDRNDRDTRDDGDDNLPFGHHRGNPL